MCAMNAYFRIVFFYFVLQTNRYFSVPDLHIFALDFRHFQLSTE